MYMFGRCASMCRYVWMGGWMGGWMNGVVLVLKACFWAQELLMGNFECSQLVLKSIRELGWGI